MNTTDRVFSVGPSAYWSIGTIVCFLLGGFNGIPIGSTETPERFIEITTAVPRATFYIFVTPTV